MTPACSLAELEPFPANCETECSMSGRRADRLAQMRGAGGLCSWLVVLCFACRDADGDSPVAEQPVDCARGCTLEAPCSLPRDGTCEFAEPASWVVYRVPEGDAVLSEPDFRSALYAFPAKYAGKIEPVRISDGAYDSEFVLTWTQAWSPDGQRFAFDATTAHVNAEPEFDSRVFVSEMEGGVPGPPRRVEGLPEGTQMAVDVWDPTSRGFSVRSSDPMPFNFFDTTVGEMYLVRRDGPELIPTLVAPRSEQVEHSIPCGGAEHVVYRTASDELVIGPASGLRDVFRSVDEVEHVLVSYDARWLALSSSHDERFRLTLLPCGEGTSRVLLDDLEEEPGAEFSDSSRYLTVHGDEASPAYYELSEPSFRRSFPEGVTSFYGWALDESFALVGNDTEDLLVFWPETGETALVRPGVDSFELHGDLLLFPETDDDGATTGFEVIDPRAPEDVLVRADASEGESIDAIAVDGAGKQVAYSESNDEGARVAVLDLVAGTESARFELPGVLGFSMDSFAPDGSGVVALDDAGEVSLYFLPLRREERKAILIHRAGFIDMMGAQPVP